MSTESALSHDRASAYLGEVQGLLIIGAIALALLAVDRLFLWLEDRGVIQWRRRGVARAATGSALAELEAQLRPPAREVRKAQEVEPKKVEDGQDP